MAKLKVVTRRLGEFETDHVIELAHMGFSYNSIAFETYGGDSDGIVNGKSVDRVKYILKREEVGVREYRNMKNTFARSIVAAIRREVDIVQVIRSASKQVAIQAKQRVA